MKSPEADDPNLQKSITEFCTRPAVYHLRTQAERMEYNIMHNQRMIRALTTEIERTQEGLYSITESIEEMEKEYDRMHKVQKV